MKPIDDKTRGSSRVQLRSKRCGPRLGPVRSDAEPIGEHPCTHYSGATDVASIA